ACRTIITNPACALQNSEARNEDRRYRRHRPDRLEERLPPAATRAPPSAGGPKNPPKGGQHGVFSPLFPRGQRGGVTARGGGNTAERGTGAGWTSARQGRRRRRCDDGAPAGGALDARKPWRLAAGRWWSRRRPGSGVGWCGSIAWEHGL